MLLAAALVLGIILIGVAARPPVLAGTSTVATSVTTTTAAGTTTSGAGTAGSAASTTTTAPRSTTTAPRSTTTTHRAGTKRVAATTTTTVPRSSVKVLVANGTSVAGAAGRYTQLLSGQGWATQAPVNASSTVSASSVYYASGQQASASAIASSLGLSSANVQPLTASVPVAGTGGVGIVLVVGPDLAAQSSVTTTTAARTG